MFLSIPLYKFTRYVTNILLMFSLHVFVCIYGRQSSNICDLCVFVYARVYERDRQTETETQSHRDTVIPRQKGGGGEKERRDRETPDPIVTFQIIGPKSKEEHLEFILAGNLTRYQIWSAHTYSSCLSELGLLGDSLGIPLKAVCVPLKFIC